MTTDLQLAHFRPYLCLSTYKSYAANLEDLDNICFAFSTPSVISHMLQERGKSNAQQQCIWRIIRRLARIAVDHKLCPVNRIDPSLIISDEAQEEQEQVQEQEQPRTLLKPRALLQDENNFLRSLIRDMIPYLSGSAHVTITTKLFDRMFNDDSF